MKSLIVYYSFEGNRRELARFMAARVGADTAEIVPVEEKTPKSGFMKYLVGGGAVLFKKTPAIKPLSVGLDDYDLVIVGTPVWFGGMTPPVRTFLTAADWKGKRTALFSMHRGGPGSALSTMRKLVEAKDGSVVASSAFVDLRRRDADKTRADALAWIESTLKAIGG